MEEKTIYKRSPSGKVVVTWILSKMLVYLVVLILFTISFTRMGAQQAATARNIFLWALIIAIVLILAALVYLVFLWKTYLYRITDKGIYFKGGILVKKERFVPFYKITDFEISRNILEQILGIAKLNFFTAGTAQKRAEVVFEGLADTETPKKTVRQFVDKAHKSSAAHSE